MDAKRPIRAAAPISGNENLVPHKQPIHNRPKSIGNLKAMTGNSALNAPPKRTAFGDVSNTARVRASDIAGKQVNKDSVKAFVKPATASINTRDVRIEDKENKKANTKENRNKPASTLSRRSNNSVQPAQQTSRVNLSNKQNGGVSLAQAPLRNGVSKKITAIYQDRQEEEVSIHSDVPSPADDLAVLVTKPGKLPRHSKSQPALRSDSHNLRLQPALPVQSDNLTETEDEDDIDDNVTEAAYEDAVEDLLRDDEDALREALVEIQRASSKTTQRNEYDASVQPKNVPELPAAAELEEYWDEEEEQELYDEQGYTTAHSYRSHGDNTTSGPTTLLAPAVTASVEDELDLARDYVAAHQTEDEIEEEAWDVSMVAEYGDEIFTYMRDLEAEMLPNAHYMDDQTEIQWSMRSVLMDWIVQVHGRFCLLPETLFLAVNYIDRFLSVKVVSLGKLQLVGATALLIAAKYEEINCPSIQEIVFMVDSGYSADEVLKAERFMLSMLHYELGWPGPMSFLRRISKADDYDLETRTLAKYFLEITIMDERFVSSPPSYLAAGAHCISRMFLDKGGWTLAHVHYSGYTLGQLKPLIKVLFECCQYPEKHHSIVYEKYASPKYKGASAIIAGKMETGLTLSQLYDGDFPEQSISSSTISDKLSSQYQASRLVSAVQG
ncbi:cyclin-like protein [Dichotomopilus funicola]|uniref:Cyclin-like protein n=1 Tax=Dichotomopilus funicola TaxID=1934379 RepID=A0AAN6V008_9PEZI|nr:cyclin-like protein [Dichotomopilus funicola]